MTSDLHVRPSPCRGAAREADRPDIKGVGPAEYLHSRRLNGRQLTWYSGEGRKGPGP